MFNDKTNNKVLFSNHLLCDLNYTITTVYLKQKAKEKYFNGSATRSDSWAPKRQLNKRSCTDFV